MAKFILWCWKGVNEQGKLKQGVTLADDITMLKDILSDKRLYLLSTHKILQTRRGCWHIGQKIQFFRQLATLLQAGISLAQGLTIIADKHPFQEWRALIQRIEQQITAGMPFSETLRQWPSLFSPVFIALVQIGELTGKLESCCQRLADRQEQLYLLKKEVMRAIRYPLFIVAVAIAVSTGMITFVLPEFAEIYTSFDAPLPALTTWVIALSTWVTTYGLAFLCGIVICLIVLFIWHKHCTALQEYEQKWLLKLPLIAPLWHGTMLSQIYTTLFLAQQAGIPLLQSLFAVEQTLSHVYWKKVLQQITEDVTCGTPLWQGLNNRGCFTPLCQQLVRIGEESGTLDLMLEKLAEWHYQTTKELAGNLATMLEPLMMLITGLIIGILVIAMYLPVFQLGEAMSGS